MTTATVNFDAVGEGFTIRAIDGQNVTHSFSGNGVCVLRSALDGGQFADHDGPQTFVHSGAPRHYRIDCVSHGGGNVAATLTVD